MMLRMSSRVLEEDQQRAMTERTKNRCCLYNKISIVRALSALSKAGRIALSEALSEAWPYPSKVVQNSPNAFWGACARSGDLETLVGFMECFIRAFTQYAFWCRGALSEAFEMSCLCDFALFEVFRTRPQNQFCCGRHFVRVLYDS